MEIQVRTHRIDAEGKSLGRTAAHIATLLQGKHKATYAPHILSGDIVEIAHVSRISLQSKKAKSTIHYRHSQYPGGIRARTLAELFKKNPREVFRKAVWNMLPKNKLRSRMMKRLRFVGKS
ncbi:MAG: 50S ribosomal protein L13 [Parcubacteria group bacterium]|nr:50S ribosomal protein L13 [Parcubacteria group bacterium]